MFNYIKRKCLKRKDRLLTERLDNLHKKYLNRYKAVRKVERYRPIYDFMTESEAKEFDALVIEHDSICIALGKKSPWFDKYRHTEALGDDAPKAYLTVTKRESETVDVMKLITNKETGKPHQSLLTEWTFDPDKEAAFQEWKKSNPPHWLSESERLQMKEVDDERD